MLFIEAQHHAIDAARLHQGDGLVDTLERPDLGNERFKIEKAVFHETIPGTVLPVIPGPG